MFVWWRRGCGRPILKIFMALTVDVHVYFVYFRRDPCLGQQTKSQKLSHFEKNVGKHRGVPPISHYTII